MNQNPLISIITPTWNRCKNVQRAIESVRKQSFEKYEHLIIDDGSTDNTVEIVNQIVEKETRLKLIPLEKNQGSNPARNIGISEAKAPLITFLDSDDEYLPHRLKTTHQFFKDHPEVNILISSFETRKGARRLDSCNPEGFVRRALFEEALFANRIFIAGSAITVRRESLDAVSGFDPSLKRMQDRDLLLRLARKEGAYLCSQMDWIKYQSTDGISRPRRGYLESLDALYLLHSHLVEKHQDVAGYLVARHLLSSLLSGHWCHLIKSYAIVRRLKSIKLTIPTMMRFYVKGKQYRRQIADQVKQNCESS